MVRRRRSALRPRVIGVLELVATGSNDHFLQQTMVAPNFAGIMPQAVAYWAQSRGHRVHYDLYTGREDLFGLLGRDLDVLFVSSFTRSAPLAYAVAQRARALGVTTVLGGPHARSFPLHAARYFDVVCGLTDRPLVHELIEGGAAPAKAGAAGVFVSAARQPNSLPSARERSPFIDHALGKALPLLRGVPVIGSLGCPYTCSFCVDATIDYQPFSAEELMLDLRFVEQRFGEGTFVHWHDPNFGVRFNDHMDAVALSGTRLRHVAESSLSLLKEGNLRRMRENNFVQLLPGVESWEDFGGKSGTAGARGMAKVERVAEHFRRIVEHVPGVQANFVLGLDDARGDAPWELTKAFVDRTSPSVFPGYFLMTDFHNAPVGRQLRAEQRTVATPFPLLDNLSWMNVRPKHYDAMEFLERTIDLLEYTFDGSRLRRRFLADRHVPLKLLNLGRGLTEGRGQLARRRSLLARMRTDPHFHAFANAERRDPPPFMIEEARRMLGRYAAAAPAELFDGPAFARSLLPDGLRV